MLTTQKITDILKIKMGETRYSELSDSIETEFNKLINNEDVSNDIWDSLYYKYAYPQIRQYGYKTEIKTRNIILELENVLLFKYTSNTSKLLQEILRHDNPNFDELEFEDKYKQIVDLGISKNILARLTHYSLWVNNSIYHWGPGENWRMYGEEESNKEAANEWVKSEEFNNVYFTLCTKDELNPYCDEWKKNNVYGSDVNSYTFIKELIHSMDLVDLAS